MNLPDFDESQMLFEERWPEYIDKFLSLSTNSKILKAYEYGGILSPENRNVIEHQIMARVVVEVLCDLCSVAGREKEDALTAASLHDFNVLEEKVGRRNGKYKHFLDMKPLKEKDRNTLRGLEFSEEVINLTDANITHEEGGPKSLTAMFVFFADACISGTEIVDIRKRFADTRVGWRSDKKQIDSKTAEENTYYYDHFWKGAPGHGDKPHDKVQLETASRICTDLTELLREKQKDTKDSKYAYIFGPNGDPNLLHEYIRDKVNEKIAYT